MARPRPPHIVDNILRAGELVIVNDGYAAASIASIAKAAEIGVGSIYHYFSDKDALREWVIIRVLRPDLELPSDLPVGRPPISISKAIEPYLNVHISLPYLFEASARELDGSIGDELRKVVTEYCDLTGRTGRVQTLVEVCSNDVEELREAWYLTYRRALVRAYETYFERRISEGAIRQFGNTTFAARWMLDTIVLFMRLRHLDHYPDELPTEHLTENVVDMLLCGFAGESI